MDKSFDRLKIIIGQESFDKLAGARVAIFGLGGVGGQAAEALVRSGVATLDLFDSDIVEVTNLNRQVLATHCTMGMDKVEAAKLRFSYINPKIHINPYKVFYSPDNSEDFDLTVYTYIIDAIDTVKSKVELIKNAYMAGVPIISCLGTGYRLRPDLLEVTDLYSTSGCPLAKALRRELSKNNITSQKVVFSREAPISGTRRQLDDGEKSSRHIVGSSALVPPAAGLLLAAEVIEHILQS